jgi:hypothetical protein
VVVNVAKSDLERKLEAANADLEQAVMDAYRARKGLLDQQRKEELKAEIRHRRIRAIELERNYVGEQLMEAQTRRTEPWPARITTSTCGLAESLPGFGSATSTP